MSDATHPSGGAHDGGRLISFPDGHTTSAPPEINLPLQLTSFVGRERELSEARGLMVNSRLLTLTGPGGAGKTRLALELATQVVEHFEDGVWWVELAPISDPNLAPQAVSRVLNVYERPGRPVTEAIVEDLRELEILLVMDNCEHLVGACALLADALVRACPGLGILATSREVLGLAGERNFPVPPLSLPDPGRPQAFESVAEYEAIRLFVERARDVVPGFELTKANAPAVARLCERLEGIPLAIELAAARVMVLSVEQISSRLEDSITLLTGGSRTAEPRQRTLRAAIDWSYDLLPEEERVLFRRLSVFAGGFTLEAAEAVCGGEGLEPGEVLDLLTHLVDKSLVMVAERGGATTRYRLLETVRQYGQERLEEGGEAGPVKEQHARYYLALAEEAEPHLVEQEVWLDRLGREHANFRAALSWSLDTEEAQDPVAERAQLGLRLAAALAQVRFWNAYGPSEGRRWLERGLAETAPSPSPVRAKALREAGWIATHQGDYELAVTLLEESMSLFEELGDRPGVATSLFFLGHLTMHGGDHERVKALGRDAEALRHELEDRQAIAHLLNLLGAAALCEGDHGQAITFLRGSLALNRELGNSWSACICLTFLGVIALEQEDPERAVGHYEENMHLLQGLGDKTGIAYCLRGMACAASLRGDPSRAARLWGTSETVSRDIGLPLSPFDRAHPDYENLVNTVRPRLGEAAWETTVAEGRAVTAEEAVEYALSAEDATPVSHQDTRTSSLLSAREAEILTLVAEGLTNPQVAKRLYLSPRTVGQHLRSIYRKFGVSSRAAAAREAAERDLI
jgi:predicted ATPase/DNA-binding CsgD family transcriptional regulator